MLTQDEYTLFTGESASQYSEEYWERLVNLAVIRLGSFLCLTVMPFEVGETPDDFKMLLANFMCATFYYQGNSDDRVASKSVRNFTVSFKTNEAANAFSNLYENYPDIIDKYSNCGEGFIAERTIVHREDCI